MLPVYQSRTGEAGRCMSACVASILELPEAAVPDFLDGDQAKAVNQFTHRHGLHYRRVPLSQPPTGWHTVEGISPRGGMHAIIGRDGRQAFDPHYPDGTGNGIVEPMYYGEFMPLDKYRAGLHRALDAAMDAAAPKDLQIVIAWTEEVQELDTARSKNVRRDLGESYKFKYALKPFAAMWLNKGTEADVAKARAYASGEGKKVFVYTGVGDPLGKAKQDVLRGKK